VRDQACSEGSQAVMMESVVTLERMMKMKYNAAVGPVGQFENEILVEKLEEIEQFRLTPSRRSTASCSPWARCTSAPPAAC